LHPAGVPVVLFMDWLSLFYPEGAVCIFGVINKQPFIIGQKPGIVCWNYVCALSNVAVINGSHYFYKHAIPPGLLVFGFSINMPSPHKLTL